MTRNLFRIEIKSFDRFHSEFPVYRWKRIQAVDRMLEVIVNLWNSIKITSVSGNSIEIILASWNSKETKPEFEELDRSDFDPTQLDRNHLGREEFDREDFERAKCDRFDLELGIQFRESWIGSQNPVKLGLLKSKWIHVRKFWTFSKLKSASRILKDISFE